MLRHHQVSTPSWIVDSATLRGSPVPLSDHEQRVLEQMERALAAEDPKFASSFRGAAARRHTRRRLLLAFTGILVGLAILLCAVVVEAIATRLPLQIIVGLAG